MNSFALLKEKIERLVQKNILLRKQQESFAERLRLREVEIERLKERCRRYEQQKEEVNGRIDQLIHRIKEIGIGP